MSRPLRLQNPGALYHITSKSNGKQKIFKDHTDFFTFIDLLGKEIMQIWGIVEVSKMFKISASIVSRIQRETERGVKINECLNKLLRKRGVRSQHLTIVCDFLFNTSYPIWSKSEHKITG